MLFMSKEDDKVESLDEKKKFVPKWSSFLQGRRRCPWRKGPVWDRDGP